MEKKQKFVSPKIAWAKNRQSKLKKIDADYNFNSKFTAVLADAKINSLQSLEDRCNALWSELETTKMQLKDVETEANDYFVDALQFVKGNFGSNSPEFEKAGGTPKSKRKNPTKMRLLNKMEKAKRV